MDPLDDLFGTEAALEGYILGSNVQAILVDFHGEATSEKQALVIYWTAGCQPLFVLTRMFHSGSPGIPGGTAARQTLDDR